MKIRPVPMTFTEDDTFVPDPRFLEIARRQWAYGEVVIMAPVEARNMKSHSHYFARLHELWLNLPEDIAKLYPTEENLRAKALVETGFYTEKIYDCKTPSHAKYLAKALRAHSEFSIIKYRGPLVRVFDPKS